MKTMYVIAQIACICALIATLYMTLAVVRAEYAGAHAPAFAYTRAVLKHT